MIDHTYGTRVHGSYRDASGQFQVTFALLLLPKTTSGLLAKARPHMAIDEEMERLAKLAMHEVFTADCLALNASSPGAALVVGSAREQAKERLLGRIRRFNKRHQAWIISTPTQQAVRLRFDYGLGAIIDYQTPQPFAARLVPLHLPLNYGGLTSFNDVFHDFPSQFYISSFPAETQAALKATLATPPLKTTKPTGPKP